MRVSWAGAALAAMLAAWPVWAQDAPEVRRVEFVGARSVSERVLRAAITTQPPRCLSPLYAPACALGDWRWAERRTRLDTAEVRRDEDRLRESYAAWGYARAAVRAEVDTLRNGVVVRFAIAEGTPTRVGTVRVTGTEALAGYQPPALPIGPGDVLAAARVAQAQQAIARTLAQRGHAFVRVQAGTEPAGDDVVNLVLQVEPGPVALFGPTVVQAGAPLERDDVRRRLAYRPGERFDPDALEHTAERLYALPIVREARLTPGPVAWSDSVVETTIVVTPGPAGDYAVEAILSSSTCLGTQASIAHRHVLGAPRAVSLTAGTSNLLSPSVCGGESDTEEFREPNFWVRGSLAQPVGGRTWLLLDGAVMREAAPGAYVRNGWQARAAVRRELARGLFATVGYAPERGDADAVGAYLCALYGACAGSDVEAGGVFTLAPAELGLQWERPRARDALGPPVPGEPWAGARWVPSAGLNVLAGSGATGSDFDFARAVVQGSATRVVSPRVQVGARARLGVLAGASQPLPPQLRLFGGGPGGVRGAPANLLGPRILVVRGDEPGDAPPCALEPGGCTGQAVDPARVAVRAQGGTALVEGGVEGRVWATRWLQLAAFVDAGAVRGGGPSGALASARTEAVITPGVGVMAITPAGPIRVDFAYDPSPARRYPLLRRTADGGYVPAGEATYDPYGHGDPDFWTAFGRRIQIQLSMGQPF